MEKHLSQLPIKAWATSELPMVQEALSLCEVPCIGCLREAARTSNRWVEGCERVTGRRRSEMGERKITS